MKSSVRFKSQCDNLDPNLNWHCDSLSQMGGFTICGFDNVGLTSHKNCQLVIFIDINTKTSIVHMDGDFTLMNQGLNSFALLSDLVNDLNVDFMFELIGQMIDFCTMRFMQAAQTHNFTNSVKGLWDCIRDSVLNPVKGFFCGYCMKKDVKKDEGGAQGQPAQGKPQDPTAADQILLEPKKNECCIKGLCDCDTECCKSLKGLCDNECCKSLKGFRCCQEFEKKRTEWSKSITSCFRRLIQMNISKIIKLWFDFIIWSFIHLFCLQIIARCMLLTKRGTEHWALGVVRQLNWLNPVLHWVYFDLIRAAMVDARRVVKLQDTFYDSSFAETYLGLLKRCTQSLFARETWIPSRNWTTSHWILALSVTIAVIYSFYASFMVICLEGVADCAESNFYCALRFFVDSISRASVYHVCSAMLSLCMEKPGDLGVLRQYRFAKPVCELLPMNRVDSMDWMAGMQFAIKAFFHAMPVRNWWLKLLLVYALLLHVPVSSFCNYFGLPSVYNCFGLCAKATVDPFSSGGARQFKIQIMRDFMKYHETNIPIPTDDPFSSEMATQFKTRIMHDLTGLQLEDPNIGKKPIEVDLKTLIDNVRYSLTHDWLSSQFADRFMDRLKGEFELELKFMKSDVQQELKRLGKSQPSKKFKKELINMINAESKKREEWSKGLKKQYDEGFKIANRLLTATAKEIRTDCNAQFNECSKQFKQVSANQTIEIQKLQDALAAATKDAKQSNAEMNGKLERIERMLSINPPTPAIV